MRLYLKLTLMIAATALIQLSLRPAGRCAWELHFAARCWMANQLQDAQWEEQLIKEARVQRARDYEAELQVQQVAASAARPTVSQSETASVPHQERNERLLSSRWAAQISNDQQANRTLGLRVGDGFSILPQAQGDMTCIE
jgi:hypothetical protein